MNYLLELKSQTHGTSIWVVMKVDKRITCIWRQLNVQLEIYIKRSFPLYPWWQHVCLWAHNCVLNPTCGLNTTFVEAPSKTFLYIPFFASQILLDTCWSSYKYSITNPNISSRMYLSIVDPLACHITHTSFDHLHFPLN
jgi:hypothetical protein